MNKLIKKTMHLVIALLCCVSLFLAGVFIVPKPMTIAAGDNEGIDPNIVTFRNVYIDSREYKNAENPQGTYNGSFDGKTFSGYITLKKGAVLYIAGSEVGKGLKVSLGNQSNPRLSVKWIDSDNQDAFSKNITANSANVTSFNETEFLFSVAFRKENQDLKVTITIGQNGQTTYSFEDTITGVADELGSVVSVECNGEFAINLRDDERAPAVPSKKIKWTSINHFYLEDGIYGYNDGTVATSGATISGIENTYFSTNVKFFGEGAQFLYAGNANDNAHGGISFMLSGGNIVASFPNATTLEDLTIEPAKAGVDTFVDASFKLGISIEKANLDEGENADDIELGIWINDVLYEQTLYTINNYAGNFGTAAGVFNPVDDGSTVELKVIEDLKITLPNKDLKKITLDRFSIKDDHYSKSNAIAVKGEYSAGLKNSYFAFNVKFNLNSSAASNSQQPALIFDSKRETDDWTGAFRIRVVSSDKLEVWTATDGSVLATINRADTNVSDFTEEFSLGISTEIVDRDGDGQENDIKYGFYVNDDFCDAIVYASSLTTQDGFLYSLNASDTVGGRIAFFTPGNSSVDISLVETLKAPIESRPLDGEGFNKITFDAFEMTDGEYKNRNNGTADFISAKGTYTKTYDNIYFSGTVKFTQNGTKASELIYAATDADGWSGIYFMPSVSGTSLTLRNTNDNNTTKTFLADSTTVESFVDKEFNLGISTKFVDLDGDGQNNDVELGIWFNDILYNDEYIYCKDFADKLGATLGLHAFVDTTVTIKSREEYKTPIASRPLDGEGFNKITFDAFEMSDGEYKNRNNGKADFISAKGTYTKTYDNIYFSGTVKFTANSDGGTSELIYAATDKDGWSGIYFIPSASGTSLIMRNTNADNDRKTFLAQKTTVGSFIGTEFNLGISTKFKDLDGDGQKDDVELGIWFNDILYNDEYIYYTDFADKLGKTLSLHAVVDTTVTIKSREDIKAPIKSRPLSGEGFTTITFENFSISDGVYVNRNNGKGADFISAKGSYTKTYDNLCFSGTVKFTQNGARASELIYAATDKDGWAGIYFMPSASGTTLTLRNTNDNNSTKTFLASKTTVPNFINNEFNIGISTRFVDFDNDGQKDDVELGIWFNDILYNDEYIYYIDFKDKLGSALSLHAFENTTITVKSRDEFFTRFMSDGMPEGLEKISINYFAINDGTYKYNSKRLTLNAPYGSSLNNTYCEFYVNPSVSEKEISIRYAGSGWTGLLIRFSKGSLYVYEASGRSARYTFTPKQAGLDAFAGNEFKIAISTQYLDLDNDGNQNDVRFGIWVEDVLCNNEYIDILDYVQYMGTVFGVFIEEETATLGLKCVNIPINFEMFGFTKDWERELGIFAKTTTLGNNSSSGTPISPETGNTPMNSMIFSCVALGGLINTEKKHGRKLSVR